MHRDHEQRLHAALRREDERERLAALLPGGSAQRPRLVASSSVIEGHASAAMACPQCGGQYRVLEHTRPRPDLRRVDVACRQCARPRALWFRIVSDEPN
jgi:hypothetical protein